MSSLLKRAKKITGFQKQKEQKEIQEVIGCIDTIEAGFVTGWAHDPNADENGTYVSLNVDGKHYGLAKADMYRKDLEKSGISDGYSGFRMAIDEALKEKTGSKIRLKINSAVAKDTVVNIEAVDGKFWLGVDNFESCHLVGSIFSEKYEGIKTIIIQERGLVVATYDVELKKGRNSLSIPMPVKLFDDSYHLISVGVEGYPFALWTDNRKLTGILTPWQYLKNSYNEPGFMGLSAQSKSRYESLRFQMSELEKSSNATVDISNVLVAHDVVVKGWLDRKDFPNLILPKHENPEVSIIIPAYNKFELTYHSIASIILSYNKTSYEVIVADDCSTDETINICDVIKNVVHIKNPENLRFLRSCNNAATYAKGDFIVMLNNDTEVTSYWLDELVTPIKKDKNIGLTGSKLLNLDGTLQEAGGIIWGSGQPWNVGNGYNPLAPEFNYTREVDYLTGAAMCISRKVWDLVNGFSAEYAPCYYEDTDIAFKVRDKGFKTVYCPMSQVVHFEGQSHGKDVKKGLKRYQEINESKFKVKWFKEYKNNGTEGIDLLINKDRNIDHRVLVIDYATPDQHADAGSYAAIQEIKLLQKLGMKVTFVPENMAHMGKLSRELQREGIEVLYAPFYNSVFDVIEKRIQEFDVIYITRYSVAEKYLKSIRARTQAKVVFNNADLHFLRELRAAGTTGEYSVEQALETRSKELAVMNDVDAILSYNETEHAVILSHNLRADNIFRCPWVLTDKEAGKSFEQRKDIAFLGGFNHHPNVEAVKYFAANVMPLLIKKEPDLKFYIYGSNPSEEIEALASENIVVVGFVKNLDDVFHNHKVIVAPLLSGAGIKGKVLEAMSYGAPQVLTSVAAEATGLSHKISAWIQDDPKKMAEGVFELCQDEVLWDKFAENSKILVEEMYSEDRGIEMMRKVFEFVGIYTK
ncbi:glycosyltransferase [Pelagibaculum spongiae]|uniref:Glycosyl transferase n=1 Tax=Pelagibaculum spongiae TaxID=2080658 RepID=A0A2V1GZ54_9GAMM|nr:glycosyltransferase [Pelagibaculum spongiae]PVZ70244.1 glycosyl transferase [Pelagibaculum spongiae]